MRAYRAAIFDFFGTLTHAIQRGPHHTGIARDLGCDPTEFMLLLDRTFVLRSRGVLGSQQETLRWLCAQLDAYPSAAALNRGCAARVAAIRADTRIRADAEPTLRRLRGHGVRIGLVSDCCHELPAFLPGLPLFRLLDTTVYSVDIGQCKPHPEMYLTACRRLHVEPEECLYVGDGGSQELTGAAEVGMTPIRLAATDLDHHLVFRPERDWTGLTVDSLADVTAFSERVPVPV